MTSQFLALSVTLFFLSPTLIWLLLLRPYCRRHGAGYTPGAHVGITMLVDWQQGTEIARQRQDRGILALCRIFIGIQIFLFAVILLSFI